MLDERQIEKLTERLISRMQKANEYFLINIGNNIKKIKNLSFTEAQQLVQMLKYGGNYEEMIKKISEYSNLDIKEVDEIFKEVTKKNQLYSKKYYDYKNVPFIEYENNYALKSQAKALATITQQEMSNFMNTRALGYSIRDDKGIVRFMGLRETYEKALDEAVLNVSQGKENFDKAMYRVLNDIGGSGLKTVDFESGRSVRLDSQIRMNLNGALRSLQNELQMQFGKEFDSDGVEITVHINPAPDHAEVQGRQFSNEEFEKFQNDEDCVDYKGKVFTAEFEGHDRRAISEYNCYHNIRSIVLGVDEPIYSDEELQKIIDDNNKGFELDGKKYTNYEGQQMMRKLESKIREEKDKQILGKASKNEELIQNSQRKIKQLNDKYNELTKKSGLLPRKDRLRVNKYKANKIEYTKNERGAIQRYLSPYSISLNEKLRNYWQLNELDKNTVTNLDSALKITKNYKGKIIRVMQNTNPDEFISGLNIGGEYSTNQYLSFSNKESYNPDANIKIIINESTQGKNLTKMNDGESEILYERNKKFIVEEIKKKKSKYIIYMKEK